MSVKKKSPAQSLPEEILPIRTTQLVVKKNMVRKCPVRGDSFVMWSTTSPGYSTKMRKANEAGE